MTTTSMRIFHISLDEMNSPKTEIYIRATIDKCFFSMIEWGSWWFVIGVLHQPSIIKLNILSSVRYTITSRVYHQSDVLPTVKYSFTYQYFITNQVFHRQRTFRDIVFEKWRYEIVNKTCWDAPNHFIWCNAPVYVTSHIPVEPTRTERHIARQVLGARARARDNPHRWYWWKHLTTTLTKAQPEDKRRTSRRMREEERGRKDIEGLEMSRILLHMSEVFAYNTLFDIAPAALHFIRWTADDNKGMLKWWWFTRWW